MARTAYDENVKVYFCDTIADKDAPTENEIAAGIDWTPFITKDGVNVPNAQNMVDTGGIDTNYDAQNVGTWGGAPLILTMFRDDTDETDSYDAISYRLRGFVVISRFGEPESGDQVEVWPVEAHEPTLQQSAANEAQKFNAAFAVTDAPSMRAVVAAS